jgi:hypothetical protein
MSVLHLSVHVLVLQEGELVYDFAWYSQMLASDPASCCFATTCRVRLRSYPGQSRRIEGWRLLRPRLLDFVGSQAAGRSVARQSHCVGEEAIFLCVHLQAHPIHLWDAISGELRCTYRAYNDKDEVTAANCIAFNQDGSKLYSGHNKSIRVFDVTRPGRDCRSVKTFQKKQEGLPGAPLACSSLAPGMVA